MAHKPSHCLSRSGPGFDPRLDGWVLTQHRDEFKLLLIHMIILI